MVVDYNPTSSDVTALLFLLQQDGVRVDAITIPGTGESHCEKAVANTLGLLALVGKEGIPVACGSPAPIAGQNQWPDDWRDAADQLPGLSLPDGGEPSSLTGPELLVAAVTQSTEPVKLLTLGPLTNVAEALALDPSLVSNLDAIYIMGGAIGVGGNVPANGVAEWNVWIDPAGARAVFESGAQIVLIPLDATNAVPVDRAWYNRLSDNLWTPSASAVFDLFSNSPGVLSGGFYFWDELAAAVMVDDSYATFETMTLSVILGGIEEGRTKPTADGVEVRVAVDADAPRFILDLISGLNGGRAVKIVTVVVDPGVEAYFAVLLQLGDRVNAQLDAWFEENEEVFVHARDPYTRVDALPSSRHIEVKIDGVTVANSTKPTLLFESGLPTRYYLPLPDVRMDLLHPSELETHCPYKGAANYFSVELDGQLHEDIMWYYKYPVEESSRIAGMVSFYNEKVDVYVDGELEERPQTHFT